jgi:hypothetical protein
MASDAGVRTSARALLRLRRAEKGLSRALGSDDRDDVLGTSMIGAGGPGFEPSSPGWSPGALPKLCYSRTLSRLPPQVLRFVEEALAA